MSAAWIVDDKLVGADRAAASVAAAGLWIAEGDDQAGMASMATLAEYR